MYRTADEVALEFIAEGQRRNITWRGIVICLAAGLVESNLTVYANPKVPESELLPHDADGDDGYSVGPLQQQVVGPPWWWGDAATCMDPTTSSGLFYARLSNLPYNDPATSPGTFAQEIQQSAYPDRYDQRMADAQAIYDRLASPQEPALTEHILPYDRAVVPQETFYDCGPASTQVVLNSLGIIVSENDLIAQIGTTENGTDNVGLIERALDRFAASGDYTSVYLTNDPPTDEQKEQLWADITNSINAGYGVVMNWEAPPNNYPRGVKGSVSPAYSGGTVFHYVACMGYDDNPDARAVWIADSGFQPQGYWISFDQCASLIPPKGYCYAAVTAPAPAPPAPNPGPVPSGPTQVGPADDQLTLRWHQLGDQTVVEALAEIRDHVLGTNDRQKTGAL